VAIHILQRRFGVAKLLITTLGAMQIAPRATTSGVAIHSITTNQPLSYMVIATVQSFATGVFFPTAK